MRLLLLLVMVFLNIAGFSLILPLLPFYGTYLDATPFGVACLFASYSLGSVFGEIYWGQKSDLHGRRPILIITTAGAALSYVAFAFSSTLLIAITIRIVSGFFSGTLGVLTSVIADISPPEVRAKYIGYFGAAFNLGFATGPAIGGLLADSDAGLTGLQLPILTAASLAAFASLWTFLMLKETKAVGSKIKQPPSYSEAVMFVKQQPMLWRLFIIAFCGIAAFSSMEAVFGLWTEENFGWTAREVGLTFIAVGSGGLFVQTILIGPLVSRFGEARIICAGITVLSLSVILMPILRLPITSVLLMALLMVGHTLTFPNAGALVSRTASPEQMGSVMGLNMASNALSRIIAPPIFGWIYSLQIDAPYYVCSLLILSLLPISWHVVRLQGKKLI